MRIRFGTPGKKLEKKGERRNGRKKYIREESDENWVILGKKKEDYFVVKIREAFQIGHEKHFKMDKLIYTLFDIFTVATFRLRSRG